LAGEVTLPTGQLVGCDPLVYLGDAPPFTVAAHPDRYPLRTWVDVLYQGQSGIALS
jgi:hypothetical protein